MRDNHRLMARRVCAEPGCPVLTDRTRCAEHEQQREQARGRRQERGYDARHDALRRVTARQVHAGRAVCWRCGEPITRSEAWHLGHCDNDRRVYHGPEHEACNTGARGPCPHPSHAVEQPFGWGGG